MADRITKTQRWLDLIALLIGRRIPLEVEEIMERVPAYAADWNTGDERVRASARRKFERDKDELRGMGIPIESERYTVHFGGETLEGYRITRRDFYLPYLRVIGGGGEAPAASALRGVELKAGEAGAAIDALRSVGAIPSFPFVREARSALAKLTFDIDVDRFPAAPVIRVERPGARELFDRLRVFSDALLAGKRVAFRYHGIHRGTPTDREVEPYGLFFEREWYLVARDPDRDGIRTFRVSRVEGPAANTQAPKTRDYSVPADFDLSSYLGRRAWELTDEAPIQADVSFRFPASLLAARNGDGEPIAEEADGTSLRRFEVSDPNPFLRWVLSFAGEAEVVSPPELRGAFHEMVAEVAALYGDA